VMTRNTCRNSSWRQSWTISWPREVPGPANSSASAYPGLALDHGLAVHRASLGWVQRAIAALREEPATTVGS
jgi:hypothetical protein